jgi:hypothetical protein
MMWHTRLPRQHLHPQWQPPPWWVPRFRVKDHPGGSVRCAAPAAERSVARGSESTGDWSDRREEIESLASRQAVESAATARVRWDKHYEANVHHLRALDQALAGAMGLSLRDFRAERVPVPLSPQQRRFYVPSADLPASVAADGGHASRSCILDVRTGERFLEVVWGPTRRIIFEALDCGSIGWPSKFFLYSRAGGVRGSYRCGCPPRQHPV